MRSRVRDGRDKYETEQFLGFGVIAQEIIPSKKSVHWRYGGTDTVKTKSLQWI